MVRQVMIISLLVFAIGTAILGMVALFVGEPEWLYPSVMVAIVMAIVAMLKILLFLVVRHREVLKGRDGPNPRVWGWFFLALSVAIAVGSLIKVVYSVVGAHPMSKDEVGVIVMALGFGLLFLLAGVIGIRTRH